MQTYPGGQSEPGSMQMWQPKAGLGGLGFTLRVLLPWPCAQDTVRGKYLLHSVERGDERKEAETSGRTAPLQCVWDVNFKNGLIPLPAPKIVKFSRTNNIGNHLLLTP